MDTKYENYILTLAEKKNMTRAAEKLFISQSSLSYYLSKLEDELKTPLFYRKKNELTPTKAGQLYIDACQEVVDIKDKLYQDISAINSKTHIVISSTSSWGIRMFSDVIPKLKKEYPEITFDLSQTDIQFLQGEIDAGRIDFALLSIAGKNEMNNSMEFLRQEELFLAMPESHSYALSHPEDNISEEDFVENFKNENYLISHKGTSNRNVAERLFSKFPRDAKYNIYDVNGIQLTANMISQGIGVGLLPESAFELTAVKPLPIKIYAFEPRVYRYNVVFYNRSTALSKPEEAFLGYVRTYFH